MPVRAVTVILQMPVRARERSMAAGTCAIFSAAYFSQSFVKACLLYTSGEGLIAGQQAAKYLDEIHKEENEYV